MPSLPPSARRLRAALDAPPRPSLRERPNPSRRPAAGRVLFEEETLPGRPGWVDVTARWVPEGETRPPEEASEAVGLLGDGSRIASLLEDIGASEVAEQLDGDPAVLAYITGVRTRRTERRRGVGSRVVSALVERLFELGARAVYLEASPDDDSIREPDLVAFYERLGFSREPDEEFGNLLVIHPRG